MSATPAAESTSAIAEAVAGLMPRARTELAELVAFRSVADPAQFPRSECEGAARWVADALRAEGFEDVEVFGTPDGTESVYGLLPGPEGAPTVLLYAHYDVQPPLDESAWHTPPFTLTEREDGRWYGRGAADCKGGILMHLTALRALRAAGADRDGGDGGTGTGLPVTVKFIAEGSEEQGTGGLQRYAEAHPELLAADTIVIGDTGNFRAGLPTVTACLRGMAELEVTVETLEGNLHSGQFGGAAPDALAALIRMLDSVRDADGGTVIDGVEPGPAWDGLDYPEDQFRRDAKVLDGVALTGTGSVADRIWAQPSVTVLGIDCPPVVGATASVQAKARATVSVRVPPGADTDEIARLLTAHLEARVPWGARAVIEQVSSGEPFLADTDSPAYGAMAKALSAAYDGRQMQTAGMGGSIPLCNTLGTLYPKAEILLIGLSEPEARIHAVNESVSPDELRRLSTAEALFLTEYARQA